MLERDEKGYLRVFKVTKARLRGWGEGV